MAEQIDPFSVLKLPFLAAKEAVGLMSTPEKFKFAMSSKQNQLIVKEMGFKLPSYRCDFGSIYCILTLKDVEGKYFDSPTLRFFWKKEDIPSWSYGDNYVEDHIVSNPVEECLKLAEQYRSIFNVGAQHFDLMDLPDDTEEVLDRLRKVFALGCDNLFILDSSISKRPRVEMDKRIVDYVLDNMKPEGGFQISGNIPEDYRHEKAMKFNEFAYTSSEWINLDDVRSIRNNKLAILYSTNLNSSDINEFLHYWANCEDDMTQFLLFSNLNDQFKEEIILEGFLSIPVKNEHGQAAHLIKIPNPGERREFIFGEVLIDSMEFSLTTFTSNSKYECYLAVFEDLEKEKNLKMELKEIEQNGEAVLGRKSEIEMELAEIRSRMMEFDFETFDFLYVL